MLQCLNLGATVFQFEHSPYVFNQAPQSETDDPFDDNFWGADDGSGGKAGGINPVMQLVEDGQLKVPSKEAIRNLSGMPIYLNETHTGEIDASYFWTNEDDGYIDDDLGSENSWKFGIFVPDYHVFGYNDAGENILNDPVLPSECASKMWGWIPQGYAVRFEVEEDFSNDDFGPDGDGVARNHLADGWVEVGTSGGNVVSATGYVGTTVSDDPSDSGVWDYISQKVEVFGATPENYLMYKPVQACILYATLETQSSCKVVVSASASSGFESLGAIQFGYYNHGLAWVEDVYENPPPVEEIHWYNVPLSATNEWAECESSSFTVTGATPVISLWLKIDQSDGPMTVRLDNFFVLAQDNEEDWYPVVVKLEPISGIQQGRKRITRNANAGGLQFTPWTDMDLLLPEIINDGTHCWNFGQGWYSVGNYEESVQDGWLAKYGIYTDESDPNISAATAYSCSGQYFDIHRRFFAASTDYWNGSTVVYREGFEPLTETTLDGEDMMPLDSMPLPSPIVIDATTPKGLNRYLYKYAAYEKRQTDCLLADSRMGSIPLVPETLKSDEGLPSYLRDMSTDGMDIRLDATYDTESTMEPIEFGNYLSFLKDARLVGVVCSATGEEGHAVDREIDVTLTAIDTSNLGNGVYETEYQLVLFDAVEGGIEISPAVRKLSNAASPENLLTATVRVNCGRVTEFKEHNILESGNVESKDITDGQIFEVHLPRYYYDIITFKTWRLEN